MLREDYRDLSTSEKILLVQEIWDSIEDDSEIKLSNAQKQLLEERQQDALDGNLSQKSWAEMKESIITSSKNIT